MKPYGSAVMLSGVRTAWNGGLDNTAENNPARSPWRFFEITCIRGAMSGIKTPGSVAIRVPPYRASGSPR